MPSQITEKQKKILVEFLKRNKQLATCQLELATLLNSVPGGAVKKKKKMERLGEREPGSQTWHDLRCRVKTKKMAIVKKKSKTGSGNDPYDSDEDDFLVEKDILDFINKVAVEGAKGVEESPLNISNLDELETESTEYSLTQSNENLTPKSHTEKEYDKEPKRKADENLTLQSHTENENDKEKPKKKRLVTTAVAVDAYQYYCEQKLAQIKQFNEERMEQIKLQTMAFQQIARAQEHQAASYDRDALSRERLVAALESIAESMLEQKP